MLNARRIHLALAVAAVLLGMGHLSFLSAAPRWAPDVLWFAGTGLAFVVAGLFNLAAARTGPPDRVAVSALLVANIGTTAFLISAWPLLKGPQVIAGAVLFAALTLVAAGSLRARRA